MKKSLMAGVCCVVTVLLASQVNAGVVTFNGLGYHEQVRFEHDGSMMNVNAGEFRIDVDGTDYTAYCVDLDHWLKDQWQADSVSVETVNGGLAAAYLYDSFADSVSSNVEAAGLQVAIWEIVDDYGDALDLSGGDFRLVSTGGVAAVAEAYLAGLPVDLRDYRTSSFILASSRCPRPSQNLIVPEPATLGFVGLALVPVLLNRRR